MSPSRAAHDALPRRPRVRGVAGPNLTPMPFENGAAND
jgi:hypothetical protein